MHMSKGYSSPEKSYNYKKREVDLANIDDVLNLRENNEVKDYFKNYDAQLGLKSLKHKSEDSNTYPSKGIKDGHSTMHNSSYKDFNNSSYNSKFKQNDHGSVSESYRLSNTSKIPYVGLSNLGNTCYMNSSLQMLINCSRFIDVLVNLPSTNLGRVSSSLRSLVKEYREAGSSRICSTSISPRNFKSSFERSHDRFYGYAQQDSQEFLRLLLEDISSETNRASKRQKYLELDEDGKSKIEQNQEYDKFFQSRENSIVIDFFYGQIVNTFTCEKCQYKNYSFEKFMEIPLLIGNKCLLRRRCQPQY